MKGQRLGYILEDVAAHVIPGDIDLWPTLQPRLRPPRRSLRSMRGKLGAGPQVLTIACIAFALTLAISPDARAQVLAQTGMVIRKIGELTFTNDIPRPPAGSTPIVTPLPDFPYVGHSRGMTLVEARAAVPFAFNIPTWVPGDYYADDQVGVCTTTSKDCSCEVAWMISKVWVKPAPAGVDSGNGNLRITIALSISRGKETLDPKNWTFTTDLATLEQLAVNGRPTALLGPEGVIPAEPRLLELSKSLMWTEGDLVYSLRGSPGVRVEDLIHMAESIP